MALDEDEKVLDRIEKISRLYYLNQFNTPEERAQIAAAREKLEDMDLVISREQMEHYFTPRDSEFAQMRTLSQMEQFVIDLVKMRYLVFDESDNPTLIISNEELQRFRDARLETERTDRILQLRQSDPADAAKIDFFEKFIASAARNYYENQTEGRPRLTLEECSDLIALGYRKGKLLTRRDGTVWFHQSLWDDWIGLHPPKDVGLLGIKPEQPVFDAASLPPNKWTYWQANHYWQEQKMSELADSMKVEKSTRKLKSIIDLMRQRQSAAMIGKQAWEAEQTLLEESRVKYAKALRAGATEKELEAILDEHKEKNKELSGKYEKKKTDAPIMGMAKIMKMAMNPLDTGLPSFLFLSKSDYEKVKKGEIKITTIIPGKPRREIGE